jgi:multidrug efflux system outer membrane protein
LPSGTPVSPQTIYQANLTASYEVDLFGRVSSNVSAAQADAAASEATYRSVLLSLQADVAQTYFRLRETDAELATLNETVRLRAESLHVVQSRFDLGDIGEFDLSRARTELSTAQSRSHRLAATTHDQRACTGGPSGQAGIEFHRRCQAAE